jgi:diguanylate cyclase (GGDEF)-like protein
MDFQIARRSKPRAFYLIAANLGLTLGLTIVVWLVGTPIESYHYASLILEVALTIFVFSLFVAVSVIRATGARISWLLIGLFLLQSGVLLDVADELKVFSSATWPAVGDLLQLVGGIIIAAAAYQFVSLTLTIANTDRLTELQNRSFHTRWVEDYLEREHHPLAMIAIDMDSFKSINDVHGHAFGDLVLKHIGQLLKNFMRGRRGIASRTGGEEFEIALKNATEATAIILAEELRLLIETNPPQGLDRITASIGVALNQKDETSSALRKRADAAAYFSKQSGKNRVSLAGSSQTISNVRRTHKT